MPMPLEATEYSSHHSFPLSTAIASSAARPDWRLNTVVNGRPPAMAPGSMPVLSCPLIAASVDWKALSTVPDTATRDPRRRWSRTASKALA